MVKWSTCEDDMTQHLRPELLYRPSKGKKPLLRSQASFWFIPIWSGSGGSNFLRCFLIYFQTSVKGSRMTATSLKLSSTGRSVSSKWSWIGLKKNRSCSSREEENFGRAGE